jgi:hypothetical protein
LSLRCSPHTSVGHRTSARGQGLDATRSWMLSTSITSVSPVSMGNVPRGIVHELAVISSAPESYREGYREGERSVLPNVLSMVPAENTRRMPASMSEDL